MIQARTGAVVLASGTAATIDFYGDGLINFALTGATEAAPVDADGNPLDALVSNDGAIYADGGTVILAAEAVGGIVDNAINMDGVTQARTAENRNGQIALVAGDGAGAVQVAGTLDASGDDAGEAGGTVHVLGDTVALNAGADVIISGDAGGGEALIGGTSLAELAPAAGTALQYQEMDAGLNVVADLAFQGGGYMPTSEVVYLDAGAAVDASATGSGDGDGGAVIVWGTEAVSFHGAITARGGADGGDGGFAEVSGGHVTIDGRFDLSAAAGESGEVLIDPTNLCAAAAAGRCTSSYSFVDVATIVATLQSGTDFTLDTSNPPGGGADPGQAGEVEIVDAITVDFAADASADDAATFFVVADSGISQQAAVTGVNGALSVDYRAVNDIVVNAPVAVGGGGGITMLSRDFVAALASIQANGDSRTATGGDVTLVAGWDGVTTDIATILATPTAYGVGGSEIVIGSGFQTAGIAVGSRFGASNFAGAAMKLTGSTTTSDASAQAGFHNPDFGGLEINGPITVALSDGAGTPGNLTATAGSRTGTFVQVGHGGFASIGAGPHGAYSGDISILLANDLIFQGSTGGVRGYAQLGHGGYNARGTHSGAITITQARDLIFTGGSNSAAYAQLGNGGGTAPGSHGGTITITQARDIALTGGAGQRAYAQIGNGGALGGGNLTEAAIVIGQVRDITLAAGGTFQEAYAQIGHGGSSANDDRTGAITIGQARDIALTSGNVLGAHALIGHGGYSGNGVMTGDITIARARDLSLTHGGSVVQVGHGGLFTGGSLTGAIDLTLEGNLTLTGGPRSNEFARIGHAGSTSALVSGNLTARVAGTATLTKGIIGHANFGSYNSGNTFVGVGGLLTADADSRFHSAATGELRLYVTSAANDAVNAAARLNGVGHGAAQAPNNQGPHAFGTGPYVTGADVAGNFAYYTIAAGWNYIVESTHAANIVAALGTGAVSLDTTQGLFDFGAQFDWDGAPSFITVDAPIVYDSANTLGFFATGDVTFNASVQNNGTGAVNTVAGWDGVTTDIAAILANTATYGLNSGIFIGDGTQTAGIAVGSRFGASNFAGKTMTLLGSTTTVNGFAQAGFHVDGTIANVHTNGAITIALSDGTGTPGDITATAGSQEGAYVQVGHGGRDLDTNVEDEGNFAGNISILLANDLTFMAGTGVQAYAQLGHGGARATGHHNGNITVTRARDLTFTGSGREAYAQLGHGGSRSDGNQSGAITIGRSRNMTLTAGGPGGAYAQLGQGGILSDGSKGGAIDVTLVGDLTMTGQDTATRYAQIGHGDELGDSDSGSTVDGNVTLRIGGALTLTNAFIGHKIDGDGTYTGGNTFIGVAGLLTADAASTFNSASPANGGELRFYLTSTANDAVNAATLLNGTAHGATAAPNNQGQFAFGTGPYVPNPSVAGNFAYYTIGGTGWDYIVESNHAANIAEALTAGAVSLDTTQGCSILAPCSTGTAARRSLPSTRPSCRPRPIR